MSEGRYQPAKSSVFGVPKSARAELTERHCGGPDNNPAPRHRLAQRWRYLQLYLPVGAYSIRSKEPDDPQLGKFAYGLLNAIFSSHGTSSLSAALDAKRPSDRPAASPLSLQTARETDSGDAAGRSLGLLASR